MHNGGLKNLWIGESHSTKEGAMLFLNMLIDVANISNFVLEDVLPLCMLSSTLIAACSQEIVLTFFCDLCDILGVLGCC
jgi:hypothetical protein